MTNSSLGDRPDWAAQRRAAAWCIHEGRRLLRAHDMFAGEISRRDNNRIFEMGRVLIDIGRQIAMGYELDSFTRPIYVAHLRATRPRKRRHGA